MPVISCKNRSSQAARLSTPGRNTDFLKLWIGESVSLFGSQITTLALPLTAVLVLKADSLQLGLMNAAAYAPYLFLTLVAGIWIDHHNRRVILIASNLVRALLLSLIPLLALAGWLRIEEVYVIALLVGCCTVFFYLAFQALLPTLVEPEHLVGANSKLSASQSVAEIGGPGLAGLLIQLMTAPLAILSDAFSFCIAALSLILIRQREPQAPPSVNGRKALKLAKESLVLTFQNAYLRASAGEAASYNLFWQIILTVFILYAVRDLQLASSQIGLLFAVGSVGALCGAMLTGPVARRIGVGRAIVTTAALGDLPLLLLPLVTGSTPGGLFLLMAAFFVQGIGITGCNVHVDSIRQILIPAHLRGSANAAYRLVVSGAVPVGALLGGWIGTAYGLRAALLVGALGLLTTWFWIVFSPMRKLQTYNMVKPLESDPV